MYLGACAGSTSGGLKCVRGVMLLKVVRNSFRQILHPNAVLPVRVNGQNIPQSKLVALFAFFALTMLMVLFTATVMIMIIVLLLCLKTTYFGALCAVSEFARHLLSFTETS